MRALFKQKAGQGLLLGEADTPVAGPGEVLVKVRAAGICGTDVHIYDWDKWSQRRIKPPLIVGHEFVGEIVECGAGVQNLELGQRVSAEGHIGCGICAFCRTGQAHICRDVKIIGVDMDGCFADYIAIKAYNLWPIPDAIPDHLAAVFDPLGNAMHTVMAEPLSGRQVLITGAGTIGLFAVGIASYAGASKIIVVEPNAAKREFAAAVGADEVLDPGSEGVREAILEMTNGLGPENLLEMSGHPDALNLGLGMLRNGGCACLLGIPSDRVTIDLAADVIFKGITLKGINGRRMFDTWYQSQNFLLADQEKVDMLVTHRIPFDDFERGFELIKNGSAVKVVLEL